MKLHTLGEGPIIFLQQLLVLGLEVEVLEHMVVEPVTAHLEEIVNTQLEICYM